MSSFPALLLLLLPPALQEKEATFDSVFRQIAPEPSEKEALERSDGQNRAVVMIQGLKPHPVSKDRPNDAIRSSWQKSGSRLSEALAPHADLFVFYYSQNLAVEKISESRNGDGRSFDDHIARLKKMGYEEIVLVAYSAGGLVARQFVEDHPDSGVTRVIQVCPPNAGTDWGRWDILVRDAQESFVNSMTKKARRRFNKARARAGKKIPDTVEFVVVMGTVTGTGDTLIKKPAQWPKDLQDQGIPVVEIKTAHYLAVRGKTGARKIAELVKDAQPRWTAEQVEKAVDDLLD